MEPGLSYTSRITVTEADTAARMGSGDMAVFATPAMAALMENAAMNAVAPYLQTESATVGTAIDIAHTKASPVGAHVEATATLVAVEGRKLVFEVAASDGTGEIGRGTHTRYIVGRERFLEGIKR